MEQSLLIILVFYQINRKKLLKKPVKLLSRMLVSKPRILLELLVKEWVVS